jgi:multicomponent Na+:H+ antiporter subunit C
MILVNYAASFFLIALGLYCMAVKKNLIKILIGMGLCDYGTNLLVVSVGFNPGGTAPIFTAGEIHPGMFFVDPVPQALTLTSIVIGACTTAMVLGLIIRIKAKYGTLDSTEIRRLRG